MDKFKTRVTALMNSSDKEIAEKLDKLEVKKLEDEILSLSLNKEVIEGYIDSINRFVKKHDKKYGLIDKNGNIN